MLQLQLFPQKLEDIKVKLAGMVLKCIGYRTLGEMLPKLIQRPNFDT